MPKKSRRKRKSFYVLLVAALVAGCVLALHHGNYWRAVWTGSFAVAAVCWIIALPYPTTCGVTTRQGSACRNPVDGVLFGCSRHTWIKFWGHFGRHERVRHERVRVRATTTRTRAEPRSADATEPRRTTVLFWLTVVATSAGFISMTTDVIGLFD
jgi:hypothetical protein